MTSFLVISHAHGLLPLVHRLRLAGHTVELMVWKKSFERAWDGRITKFPRGPKGEVPHEAIERAGELAAAGKVEIITDMTSLEFPVPVYGRLEVPDPPRLSLRVGGWFDGEEMVDHHLLVCDVGAQAGGMGAQTLGGMTLVRPGPDIDLSLAGMLWQKVVDELKARDFKGLVQGDIDSIVTAQGPDHRKSHRSNKSEIDSSDGEKKEKVRVIASPRVDEA